jgi:P-type conjugative transfer ATPase TrbB
MEDIQITETQERLYAKLYHDLGKEIIGYLADKDINEIMLNPDGSLWVDRASLGQEKVGFLNRLQAFSILYSVAGVNNFIVSPRFPRLEAELPHYKELQGQRFTGQIPPIVSNPSFTLRKKSEKIFTLEDYVSTSRLTQNQKEVLQELVKNRKNILVCGGPGSGKTTVTNALIVEAVKTDTHQRFIILEDTPELQCTAPNKVSLVTSVDVNMTGLLRAAMRMRPDRILIGEVRGAEALDMLKAWNTGCPGGICTVHANGASEAIQRILDLSMEAGLVHPPISLLLHTIDAVVSVVRRENQKGFISEILSLKGVEHNVFQFEKLA